MLKPEMNRYWKTVVDTIKEGIIIVDRKGVIVSVNKAVDKLLGYKEGELIGKPCSVLDCNMCHIVRDQAGQHWCNLFKSGEIRMKQCTMKKKNRQSFHLLKNASLLHDSSGQVIGAVETLTDISEIIEKDHQIEEFRRELRSRDGFHGSLGVSPPMVRVFDLLAKVAQSDAPVIIFGESGTGKELAAEAIHESGPRQGKPFVKVNCAALSESLLESELFGHVKGAFTGAIRDREGRFEAAHGGDIFLDEVGDLPLSTQVKLLRVLENKMIERVGDHKPKPIDVRIISATHKDLKTLVDKGLFREDLFFRINVIPVQLPALRERREDIPLLAETFFRRMKLKSGKPIQGINPETMEVFMGYDWPGNIRELRSVFEYAFVTCPEGLIQPHHLPSSLFQRSGRTPSPERVPVNPMEKKKQELLEALKQAKGNQSEAARILGVSRVTIWNRMKQFGILAKDNFQS
ncbi:MAG: sigma 54-interacting transcriptional regulator [Deltaproteobacteria bacterium]|nr:sigma 54-interacting transcriptional regulator [Deltaproteobacteria bacterium]